VVASLAGGYGFEDFAGAGGDQELADFRGKVFDVIGPLEIVPAGAIGDGGEGFAVHGDTEIRLAGDIVQGDVGGLEAYEIEVGAESGESPAAIVGVGDGVAELPVDGFATAQVFPGVAHEAALGNACFELGRVDSMMPAEAVF